MFLKGKVLQTIDSPINGKIEVVKSIAFGTYISIGGLTQSGGIVYEIWEKTIKRIRKRKPQVNRCLILGLGGGSVYKVIKTIWPNSKSMGVEIDRLMIALGKEYLNLQDININIEDAFDFCKKESKLEKHYDLIIVDLYIGDKYPEKFESMEFINSIKKILSKNGMVIFNRLFYDRKRKEALSFSKILQKEFKNVEFFYPEANLMFLCYDS